MPLRLPSNMPLSRLVCPAKEILYLLFDLLKKLCLFGNLPEKNLHLRQRSEIGVRVAPNPARSYLLGQSSDVLTQ